ncbi:MAG TPA: LLM class flavin-dependent oxidoreductase [Solirubrobacterales bacterium]|jgi:probable F420-dependent oxidoreductase|nr:LLM class flavin-dependent oxidoreductase [Solirubrobacterales bacterium]
MIRAEEEGGSGRPRVGLYLHEGVPTARIARLAERLGFDYGTCGEHLLFHQPVPNSLIRLAAAAGATERLLLLSSLTLAPLYPAALLAKMTAELDVVSGGRFSLGVGVGGEFAPEFEAVGIPVGERGARTDEALELLVRLLSEREVSFDGRFNRLRDFTIEPPAVQAPRPPLWVGGRSGPAIRRAARFADAWLPYFITPARLRQGTEALGEQAVAAGRAANDLETAVFLFTSVDRDRERAREMARRSLGGSYRQDVSGLVDKYMLAGTPGECRQKLAEYTGAGAGTVVFSLACPAEKAEGMAAMLAEDVLGLTPRGAGR